VRYGGDESSLSAGTESTKRCKLADRIRAKIERSSFYRRPPAKGFADRQFWIAVFPQHGAVAQQLLKAPNGDVRGPRLQEKLHSRHRRTVSGARTKSQTRPRLRFRNFKDSRREADFLIALAAESLYLGSSVLRR